MLQNNEEQGNQLSPHPHTRHEVIAMLKLTTENLNIYRASHKREEEIQSYKNKHQNHRLRTISRKNYCGIKWILHPGNLHPVGSNVQNIKLFDSHKGCLNRCTNAEKKKHGQKTAIKQDCRSWRAPFILMCYC